jgi:pimeloyl-ACP methyl ester carboxylesterase
VAIPASPGHLAGLDGRPTAGAETACPAALLVPGFTGSKEDFLPTLAPLLATGRRVVAYDQRGQYQSVGVDDPAAYAVARLASDLLAVIDWIGGPVHLVGHSFGGLVARDAVLTRPDIARSLTLLDSGPAALGGQRRSYLELMAPIIREGGLPAVWAAMEAVRTADPRMELLPAEIVAFLEARFLSQHPLAVETTGQALLDEPDRVDELRAGYPGPILVACGEADDAWSPEVQQAMAERLGAAFEVIPDAVHSPAAENPEGTAKVLTAFWSGAEGSTRP